MSFGVLWFVCEVMACYTGGSNATNGVYASGAVTLRVLYCRVLDIIILLSSLYIFQEMPHVTVCYFVSLLYWLCVIELSWLCMWISPDQCDCRMFYDSLVYM